MKKHRPKSKQHFNENIAYQVIEPLEDGVKQLGWMLQTVYQLLYSVQRLQLKLTVLQKKTGGLTPFFGNSFILLNSAMIKFHTFLIQVQVCFRVEKY
jgi:hypothetical protein